MVIKKKKILINSFEYNILFISKFKEFISYINMNKSIYNTLKLKIYLLIIVIPD